MTTITPNLEKVISDLETLKDSIDKNIKDIQDLKMPIPHNQYDKLFDQVTRNNIAIQQYNQQLQEINNLMILLQEKNNKISEEINNNKFKFGLQGQLKRQIKSQQDVTSLPPLVQDIVNSPIVPLPPFENRGGKKRRKTRKNRRTRK